MTEYVDFALSDLVFFCLTQDSIASCHNSHCSSNLESDRRTDRCLTLSFIETKQIAILKKKNILKKLWLNLSSENQPYNYRRKNIIIFEFSMSELVEKDTSLAYIGQFWFGRQFWAKNAKNRTRGS